MIDILVLNIENVLNYIESQKIIKDNIVKIMFKLSHFKGFIDGQLLKFNGECFLQNGFEIDFNGDLKVRDFQILEADSNSKTYIGHSGLIIIYIARENKTINENKSQVTKQPKRKFIR